MAPILGTNLSGSMMNASFDTSYKYVEPEPVTLNLGRITGQIAMAPTPIYKMSHQKFSMAKATRVKKKTLADTIDGLLSKSQTIDKPQTTFYLSPPEIPHDNPAYLNALYSTQITDTSCHSVLNHLLSRPVPSIPKPKNRKRTDQIVPNYVPTVPAPGQTSGTNSVPGKNCKYCGKFYASTSAHSMHVRTHEMRCVCPVCGKRFSRTWLLQCHARTHTGEKPFTCEKCNKSFTDKSNYRAHTQTHSDVKPFACRACGKSFALRSYLYKHERSCSNPTPNESTLAPPNS